ncbi:MAG TPA: hypothetical protein PL105_09770, partial [Caldilineaceae bacterium]|nr:hypothetical protein [Caldilineaceae bacterium]
LPAATLANGLLTGATATLANGLLTVHTTNVSQRDFLQARLARQIARSASRLAGRAIDTQFV